MFFIFSFLYLSFITIYVQSMNIFKSATHIKLIAIGSSKSITHIQEWMVLFIFFNFFIFLLTLYSLRFSCSHSLLFFFLFWVDLRVMIFGFISKWGCSAAKGHHEEVWLLGFEGGRRERLYFFCFNWWEREMKWIWKRKKKKTNSIPIAMFWFSYYYLCS